MGTLRLASRTFVDKEVKFPTVHWYSNLNTSPFSTYKFAVRVHVLPHLDRHLMDASWTHSPEEVLSHFDVKPEQGLSDARAIKNREVYGKNGAWTGLVSLVQRQLTSLTLRTPGRPTYSSLGAHLRAIQRPACLDSPCICPGFVHPRARRRIGRHNQSSNRFRRTPRYPPYSCGKRNSMGHSGNQCGESDRCMYSVDQLLDMND